MSARPIFETCLSPKLLPLYDLSGKVAVVTDVLRATSCMVAGFSNGVESIVPVTSPEACEPYRERGFLRAGERGGVKLGGFDLGNSPYDYLEKGLRGKSVVVTTTNGTKALRASEEAGAAQVWVGAFPNIDAIADYLQKEGLSLIAVCAGWQDRFCLEDTLFAGGLAHRLSNTHSQGCDATNSARWLYEHHKEDLKGALSNTDHARRLKKLGGEKSESVQKDLDFCSTEGGLDVVPKLHGEGLSILY